LRAQRGRLALLAAALCAAGQLAGCASERLARPSTGIVQRGVASWYGGEFHGKPTASGEIYDMYSLSAAHRELPLDTLIEVRNLDNGRSVQVRINDRGPFVRGRMLDLSYAAARELGMIGAGLARVEIRVVEVGMGRPGETRLTRYTVQVGAYRDYRNALDVQTRVAVDFPGVEIESAGGWHRVRIGLFGTRDEAVELRRRLRQRGHDGIIVPLS
jgi:rare lipoprotein A